MKKIIESLGWKEIARYRDGGSIEYEYKDYRLRYYGDMIHPRDEVIMSKKPNRYENAPYELVFKGDIVSENQLETLMAIFGI